MQWDGGSSRMTAAQSSRKFESRYLTQSRRGRAICERAATAFWIPPPIRRPQAAYSGYAVTTGAQRSTCRIVRGSCGLVRSHGPCPFTPPHSSGRLQRLAVHRNEAIAYSAGQPSHSCRPQPRPGLQGNSRF